ncbi:MAG: HD-GYP domain-containing protein [Azoarcus sp.]|nr:HD-GYP domain-containing protein [Azoarcus sp.]
MFPEKSGAADSDGGIELDPARLCPGLFVRLNLSWMQHSFVFSQFRIASESQVRELQALRLKSITWYPARSTAQPLPEGGQPQATAAVAAAVRSEGVVAPDQPGLDVPGGGVAGDAVSSAANSIGAGPGATVAGEESAPISDVTLQKAAQARKLAAQRAEIARCESQYVSAAADVRTVMRDVFPAAGKAVESARKLVGGIVDGLAQSGGIVIHLMNEKLSDETAYFHVLNVVILSMLLGRELKLPPEALRLLGEGALFHDIGKLKVPDTVLRNSRRNRHEEEFFRLHTTYGREIAGEVGALAPAVCEIIELHHETMDGKGYPRGLSGQKIPLLARIVGITNRYDNLCNPLVADAALTPAEALTQMFRTEGNAWDKIMLQVFIRLMGVYPPGSLVQLSNGNVALVVAVNHADLLSPSVMVFDPSIPKESALVVDLMEEPDVKIDLVLNPRELDRAALNYLSPRRRMSYYHSHRT